MIALEAKTGKYRWHFQQVHHDLWDYDSPNPVILFDVKLGGRVRKAAAEASKTGWVYILDRVTGKPLLGIDEKPVLQDSRQRTSPLSLFREETLLFQHEDIAHEDFPLVNHGRIFTPFWIKGGVSETVRKRRCELAAEFLRSRDQLLLRLRQDRAELFKGGEENQAIPREGEDYLGGAFGGAPEATGIFAALDMKTNRLVWQQRWKDRCYSGSVATAGGLVFVGRNDGRLTALESSTGKHLWEFQTGAGVNAPSSVFDYEGEEYVVAYSAGNLFAGSPRGDSVWLFSLKGTLDPAAPAFTIPSGLMSGPAAPAELANGQKVFGQICSACHGPSGEGGHGGPSLKNSRDLAKIVQIVQQGGGQMPSLGSSLTAKDIWDVSAYVREKLAQ